VDDGSLVALAATDAFARGAPAPLAIAPDGAVLFARSKPREASADLYQLDAAGKLTVLAQAQALLATAGPPGDGRGLPPAGSAAEGQRGSIDGAPDGITAIDMSADGARILVPLAGRAFVIERATAAVRELDLGPHRDPALSPDGKRVAFVRDGDLWVATIGEAQPTRVAQHPSGVAYGIADDAAAVFGRRRGHAWAPDSLALVFERSDARGIDPLYVGDPRHPERAPVAVARARVGRPIAKVDLGIVSIRGGAPRWATWDLARYPYVAHMIWPARGPLTAIVVGRTQTQLAVLAIDTATGATRQVLTERDPAWLNVPPDALTWLADGSGFLWQTESHGSRSLDHHGADGALIRAVVTADVGLRRVVGLSADGRDVVIEAAADAREQHVWRVPLAGGAPVPLTRDGGLHHAWSEHDVVVIRSEARAGGQRTVVVRGSTAPVALPSLAEHPALPSTKLDSVTLDDHTLPVALTRPRAFDPKVRYPVLVLLDGALGQTPVVDAIDRYALDQWYADAGFVVVRVDSRGTADRGRDWQRAISGDVLTLPMTDQLGALKQLGARYPELDLARVGVVGSGVAGGLAAIGAMIHPDAFAAAVAIAPITEWTLVEAAFGERVMKTPADNAEGYRRASAVTYAEQAGRPLLLIHDPADPTVPFAHTVALIDALSAAGKPVELATLPARGPLDLTLARVHRTLAFLRGHLGPPIRPAVMPAARSEEDEEREEEARERAAAKAKP